MTEPGIPPRRVAEALRAILEEAVRPPERLKIGSALTAFGQRFGGVDLDAPGDQTLTRPAVFE